MARGIGTFYYVPVLLPLRVPSYVPYFTLMCYLRNANESGRHGYAANTTVWYAPCHCKVLGTSGFPLV